MYNKTLQSYVKIYLQVYKFKLKFVNSFVKKKKPQLLFIYMISKNKILPSSNFCCF